MNSFPKIAIVYLSFHCEPYIDDVVSALKKVTYPKDKLEFIIVDNPHPEHGHSVRYIEERVMPLSGKEIPHTTLLPQKENLGFAGGNNAGVDWALEHGFEYVFFHNNDGFVASNAFEPLVEAMENDKEIGLAQSLMLLHPETELLNSAGNSMHYLGFGYCDQYRTKIKELDLPSVKEVSYASGAALMVRSELIRKFGSWDHDFFLYHEDLELGWRIRLAGFVNVLSTKSIAYHDYEFKRFNQKFYWMERNRILVHFSHLRWSTLVLLIPFLFFAECGLIVFSLKGGWFKEKCLVYVNLLSPRTWRYVAKKRGESHLLRRVSDQEIVQLWTGKIEHQETSSPVVDKFINPFLAMCWFILKKLIRG